MAEPLHEVVFVKSSPDVTSCPSSTLPEFAFTGRSNVGKSSLINYLTGLKKLAKTSSQPGRTRLINHFRVDEKWYLVDLPGYGYARVSKAERNRFLPLIQEYLARRSSLTCLFLLIDCRHAPQPVDRAFLRWLGEHGVPFVLCFTKTDKLSSTRLESYFKNYKKTLLTEWEFLPPVFFTSTLKKKGRDEILDYIEQTIKETENSG